MKKHEPVKSFNGISVILLRGAMGKHYMKDWTEEQVKEYKDCLLYTSPSPRDGLLSRMPSSA